MSFLLNPVIFPRKKSSYNEYSLQNLFWVPEGFIELANSVLSISDTEEGYGKLSPLLLDSIYKLAIDQKTPFIACTFNSSSSDANSYILYFHANCVDLGDIDDELCMISQTTKCHIIAFEYPGYGIRLDKKCTPEAIERDAKSVYALLRMFAKPDQIFFAARSIGTGPATAIASHLRSINEKIAGLILQSPYTSLSDLITDYVPLFSWNRILKTWDVSSGLKILGDVPLLVIHGEKDEVVAIKHAYELVEVHKKAAEDSCRVLESTDLNVTKVPTVLSVSDTSSHNSYRVRFEICEPIDVFSKNSLINPVQVDNFFQKYPILYNIKDYIPQKNTGTSLFEKLRFCSCMDKDC